MGIKFIDVSYNILKELNLSFNSANITSIISRNDNEIKTLFNLIYALEIPSNGEIKLERTCIDKNIQSKSINNIRKKISYLSDETILFNINVMEDMKVISRKKRPKKLDEMLKLFDLEKSILKKNYNDLSKSEKKKIMIISLLLKDSKYILLINPTNNLDYMSTQALIKILKSLKRDDKTIILSSNDSDFLLQVSDSVMLFENGRVLSYGNKYEILSSKALNKLEFNNPELLNFRTKVEETKNRKLNYRDNILDLIKDIYRDVK